MPFFRIFQKERVGTVRWYNLSEFSNGKVLMTILALWEAIILSLCCENTLCRKIGGKALDNPKWQRADRFYEGYKFTTI